MEKNQFQQIINKKKKEINSKISQNSKKGAGISKPPKHQVIAKLTSFILGNANIDPLYRECSLKNFKTKYLSPENREAYIKIRNYIKNIDTVINVPQSLYLYSVYPGIGKTHLAVAALRNLAKKLAENEYERKETIQYGNLPYSYNWTPVYFINVSEGLMDIKNDIRGSDIDFKQSEIYRNVKYARLVVLDDIFNEIRYTPFVLETLLYWIDYRLKNNLATIFTSNHNFEEFLEDNSPVKDERLKVIARNAASRVNKMVMGNKICLESSSETDFRRRKI